MPKEATKILRVVLWGIRPESEEQSAKGREVKSLSRVRLFATPWTVACQAPLSKGFSRQEYWSGLPCPSPGDLPKSGRELMSHISGGFFTV